MAVSDPRIALIGDYNAAVKAHQAIPRALALAGESLGHGCACEWLHTGTLREDPSEQLSEFDGIWCVPASPYVNPRGAIAAIRMARETGKPFLGTCGGFQHAMLEYAEAVWGVARAVHAELDPTADNPVIAPLECSLVDKDGEVRFAAGSRWVRCMECRQRARIPLPLRPQSRVQRPARERTAARQCVGCRRRRAGGRARRASIFCCDAVPAGAIGSFGPDPPLIRAFVHAPFPTATSPAEAGHCMTDLPSPDGCLNCLPPNVIVPAGHNARLKQGRRHEVHVDGFQRRQAFSGHERGRPRESRGPIRGLHGGAQDRRCLRWRRAAAAGRDGDDRARGQRQDRSVERTLRGDQGTARRLFPDRVPDLDAAISWASRCPGASHGIVEVRPIWPM